MSGRDLHTFITNHRAEDVGKSAETGSETLLACDIVAHWSVEQIWPEAPMLNSPGPVKSLMLLSEAALIVFIHLPLWVTAELLKKTVWHS